MKEQQDHHFFVFADFIALAKRSKKQLVFGLCLFAILGMVTSFYFPIQYEAAAIFREENSTYRKQEKSLVSELLDPSRRGSSQSESAALLTSPKILTQVVKNLGLQATVDDCGLLGRIRRRAQDIFLAVKGSPLPERSSFVFRRVACSGKKASYFLLFSSPSRFELQNLNGALLAQGEIGKKVVFKDGSFIVAKTPQNVDLFHRYRLTFSPLLPLVMQLAQAIEVAPVEKSTSLLELKFSHRTSLVAIDVLNETMASYQRFLIKEHAEFSQETMTYLAKQQAELEKKVDQDWTGYASYLKDNLKEKGFFTVERELELAMGKQRDYAKRLLDLDVEKKRLVGTASFASANRQFADAIIKLQSDLMAMEKKRDAMTIALTTEQGLAHSQPNAAPSFETLNPLCNKVNAFSGAKSRLETVREKKEQLVALIDKVETHCPPYIEAVWSERIAALYPKMPCFEKKEEATAFLSRQLDLLALEEEICRQQILCPSKQQEEFSGADLKMVEGFYATYVEERDHYQEKIKKLTIAKKQLDRPNFEFGSLVELLPDAGSQEIARKMGELAQSMRNKRHFGAKELDRMERLLEQYQKDLHWHVDQTIALYELRADVLKEKIVTTTHALLNLTNREIALIERELQRKTEAELSQLTAEAHLINQQIDKLKEEMSELPDSWPRERKIDFNTQLNLKMLEKMTELVESKNIEHYLSVARSKPFCLATASLVPTAPPIRFFALLGAAIGLVITWGWLILRAVVKGLPLTFANLALRGYPMFKQATCASQAQLEALRRVALFLHQRTGVISCLFERESEDLIRLARLLARSERRVLVIDLESAQVDSVERPGLFNYLVQKGEEPVIKEEQKVAVLSWGGSPQFQAEWLKTTRFSAYLKRLRIQYDYILVASRVRATTAEAEGLLLFSDTMLITLRSYTSQQLMPYFKWASQQKDQSLGFFIKTHARVL
ncbi:MAG: hypothetical protein AAF443_06085 [Chlamydiota bacterium]